jgi:hypothetical protein
MSEHRDHLVGDALRRLDVPDHGPDFWAALESRLADDDLVDEPGTAGPEEEVDADVVDLAASPAARRRLTDRRRTPLLALVAAVAIVVALVVGAGLLDPTGEQESRLDTATVPDQEPAPDAPAPDVTPTVPEAPSPGLADRAEDIARDWLDRLFAGDVDGAYGLLDETSRSLMSREDFELLGSGLFEGAAAFAVDGIDRQVAAYDRAAGLFHVVTFSGEVEREGMVETASYPVVVTGTGVHFLINGPQVELDPDYADSSGTTLASPLVVLVDPAAQDAWFGFDGEEPTVLTERGRVSIDVEAAAGAGTHLVHLVAVDGDRITARAHTVVVP